jgi:O-antigen ligase
MSPRKLELFSLCAVLLLGWAALAFGAEYSWAYAPLLVFSFVVGVLGLLASPSARFPSPALALALVAVFIGGLVQLAPLSRRAITAVSPSSVAADYRQLYTKATMRSGDPAAASESEALRPVSIAPSRTVLGLAFLAAFTILLLGSARGISAVGAQSIARGILWLGVVVALVGIIQKAVASEAVYGFWYPPKGGVPFAPLINANHFAGWMVLAMSSSIGYFAGGVARGLRGVKRDWRHRVLWLSSPEANETLLAGFAVVVMALSMVLSASRSGLLCLASAILLSGWWVAQRQSSRPRRLIAAVYLVFVLLAAASWGRVDGVIQQFQGATPDIGGRLGIWQDTLRIIQDFPLTGTGLNTYGIAMLHYQTVQDGNLYIEAHNDYLQLVAEGGLLLGAPILLALALFVREVWRRFREAADDTRTYWLRAGAVTGLGAIAFQEVFDFTLQMPGAAALFAVLVAIAIHRPPHGARDSSVLVREPLAPQRGCRAGDPALPPGRATVGQP